jgi:hypothetical protein
MPADPRLDHRRPGASLVEALAVLTLTSLVVAVVIGLCVAQLRLARATAERALTSEAVRTVTSVLSGEARRMMPEDVIAASADSLAIRAFRGAGIPCGSTGTGILVRYQGDRAPDPAKDSVLVLTPAATSAVALLDITAAPGACMTLPDEAVLEWRFATALPAESVLLVFESGSYHLTGQALRYRIGGGGRQPLTAEALRHPWTRFTGIGTDAIGFVLQTPLGQSVHAAPFAYGGPPP